MKKIRPLGHYVLIEARKIEDKTKGGIIMPSDSVKREQNAAEFGKVIKFGPTAFQNMAGCRKDSAPADWGIKVGDEIEYRRYEGKPSGVEGSELLRYIPDCHIIGGIDEVDA